LRARGPRGEGPKPRSSTPAALQLIDDESKKALTTRSISLTVSQDGRRNSF
jgi:hypothetical protein